jgi:hypothetical protein
MPEVGQHVSHRVRYFARRAQHVLVVAIGKDRTASPKTRIQRLRDPDSKPLHRAPESGRAFALHDEVEVISLDGVVDDARPEPLARLVQGAQKCARGGLASQISHRRPEPLRHVNRAARGKRRPRRVRYARSDQPRMRQRARAAGSFAPASPLRQRKRQLPRLRHFRVLHRLAQLEKRILRMPARAAGKRRHRGRAQVTPDAHQTSSGRRHPLHRPQRAMEIVCQVRTQISRPDPQGGISPARRSAPCDRSRGSLRKRDAGHRRARPRRMSTSALRPERAHLRFLP